MSMPRADRRDDSYDNGVNHPRSQRSEPLSYHELRASLMTVRAQRAELEQRVHATEQQVEHQQQLYQEAQQQHQSTLVLYREAQSQADSYLARYTAEQAKSHELLLKYEAAQGEAQRYITLYEESQTQLVLERRSKAGIKGWETRRKRENERLKQEIGEMAVLLRDSLARKEQAITHLEALADRMDRIQSLVNSIEADDTQSPANFLQKLAHIWQAMKTILAE